MNLSATLRDRLPSAAVAIALQAGLLALLVFSFQAVRHMSEEKETILILPPPAKIVPRAPVTIDARGKPPQAVRPAAPTALPPYALPSFNFSAPQSGTAPLGSGAAEDLNRDIAKCRVENYGNLNASERQRCPPPEGLARRDPSLAPLNPDKPVKNAPVWQAEVDRRNAPPGLPGASGGIVGILETLLFNPGAYADKRSYSYGPQDPPPMDGAEMTRQYALNGSGCPELDDTTKKNCQHDRAAVKTDPPMAGTGTPKVHASEAQFQEALAAYQVRRGLGRTGGSALVSAKQEESGHEQDRNTGAGAGPVATGPDIGAGGR